MPSLSIKNLLIELVEVVTVGFPFCVFKILSGVILRTFVEAPVLQYFGFFLIALGGLDLWINALNSVGLVFLRRRVIRTCLLDLLIHPEWSWQDLGNSLDVLLSFSLVALVIGNGWLKHLSREQVDIWDISVVFNVMGAGLSRFGSSLKNLERGR